MRRLIIFFVGLAILGAAADAMAGDSFPTFTEQELLINIDTNTLGFRPTGSTNFAFPDDTGFVPVVLSSTNSYVTYAIWGQAFTNPATGQLQTIATGFSGTNTDKSSPWKTLTELLAVYQQGVTSNAISPLYDSAGHGFLNGIFSNPSMLANFTNFSSSITGMQVLIGFNSATNGLTAFVRLNAADWNDIMPFYFNHTNGVYLLSTITNSQPVISNMGMFLNTHSVAQFFNPLSQAPCMITASGGPAGLIICQGQRTTLTAVGGMASYLWTGPEQSGATNISIIVGTAGTYSVRQINGAGLTNTCSVSLVVNPIPVVSITGHTTICQGTSTTLSGPMGMSNYLWFGPQNNGLNAQSNTLNVAGTYELIVTDSNGCQNAVAFPVTVIQCP